MCAAMLILLQLSILALPHICIEQDTCRACNSLSLGSALTLGRADW